MHGRKLQKSKTVSCKRLPGILEVMEKLPPKNLAMEKREESLIPAKYISRVVWEKIISDNPYNSQQDRFHG
jgi:hypothetical protein